MWGTAADRLSVRWLDKRPGRDRALKLRELVGLIAFAGGLVEGAEFESPFACWREFHPRVMQEGQRRNQETLTASFASALFERGVIDAFSRLRGQPVYDMVRDDLLGIDAGAVHEELRGHRVGQSMHPLPPRYCHIRHTVGPADLLSPDDLSEADRIGDGLPETLVENIDRYGLRYFKVKISGDISADLVRLAKIWNVLPKTPETTVTLDANEAFTRLNEFEQFVEECSARLPGLFDHLAYVEQPLARGLTLDPATRESVRRINAKKLLLIDEADGSVDAFRRAHAIGYSGTSHKNCKGFFKSLLNGALVEKFRAAGQEAFLSGEDLQNLPIVPLHQDFAAVAVLGLNHCERNGHHLNYGLSMLSEKDRASIAQHHAGLYEERAGEWFLKIRGGVVDISSLQVPGFGVVDEPDFGSMEPMTAWLERRFPAS